MLSDLRFAARQLAKTPGFTFVAVLTLALGIGSATTAFTAVNALLLRPLPFIQNQDRMLWVNEALPEKSIDRAGISLADFFDWRARTKTLEALWVYEDRTAILSGRGEPTRKLCNAISAGAFQAMGVEPIRGRNFLPTEDQPGAPPVAILGYALWKREFGGAEDIVGQIVKLNGVDTTIVGVMPAGWRYPERADLWQPMQANPADAMRGHFHGDGHAMLKPGVTLDEARAEFATISAALAKEFPATNAGLVAVLRPVREEAAEDASHLALLLFGAVMFVFLIACANVANLLLARASSRTKEIAIRLALGASRGQLIGQLLLESLLLSVIGTVGGLVLALWGIDLTVAQIPEDHHPFWLQFNIDPRVFGFVVVLAVIATVLFGLVPAWQTSRPDIVEEIKEGGRTAGAARSHTLRHALVIIEIALALMLLVGAGLMMRSVLLLHHSAPGFETRGVLTFRLGFPATVSEDKAVWRRFFEDLMTRLAAVPGVEAASATSSLPGIGQGGFATFLREGQAEPANMTDAQAALYRTITPRYFETLRIPLKAGRFFEARDDAEHPRVTIIDEFFARKYFPSENPLGQRIRARGKPGEPPKWMEIVGVVGTTRRVFDRDESSGTFYVAQSQEPSNFMSVAVRVSGNPVSFVPVARNEVFAVNKELPIYYEMTLQRAIEQSDAVWIRRFFGVLFTAFAVVALLLASIGIYGVMAYAVAQRTQEIGMRMALGAQPRDVIRMVVRHGLRLVGIGLGVGFVAAFFTAQVLSGNLYGVSPHDPPTFAIVPLLLAAVALLACWLPTRRATMIDPNAALRAE